MVPPDSIRGNGQKVKHRKFLVDSHKVVLCVCVRVIEQVAREVLGLILEDFKDHLLMVLELPLGSPV